ncbi:MAG: DNA primase [Omnitrophica WOR_2 bacterium GWF2_38_59]|nr:MAG: DNA primase [Omnitrophica WOR_2 bacterium GWF2_38_59]OGX46830.1 MAG: DNA primase [Omnitrophica WOR_2 bacterium RIFOXYA2_FULL_38_17]OGX51630.1 MAG: DNA primase [Omnitrophica WOR_2 bacterium RIFOXYA12_FULL_38_10]OGX58774.1 MAG: DNA primase [Omnitrophica WOR_2 bacterium RIFOXYC2_FULL_38_12]OGX59671.1 MAG: DNA primase [Omnitrophica WOR_2 bacterium RIFOXYB2_FULL_38_16]HBG61517.1 DNA primase [Candidatus Omnitrophota bacterium]
MVLIPEEIVSQVIDRSDIVEIISSYIPLKRAGRNFKAACPFHNEKTPSFVVNPDKQIFHCFGCGVGGNVVSFVMKQDNMDFPEAIRVLAQKVNVVIEEVDEPTRRSTNERLLIFKLNELAANYFQENLLSTRTKMASDARKYLKERNVDFETVKNFKVGLAVDKWDGLLEHLKNKGVSLGLMEKAGLIIPRDNGRGFYDRFRNRIIFPIFDTRGNCRAFGARALEDNQAKYLNSPETIVYTKGNHLYGFHLAKNSITQEDAVIVVEGYLDCIMPYQFGVQNIVASLGTALTVEQIRLIRRYSRNVILLFDMDKAGEAAMLRSLDTLVEEEMNVKVAILDEGEDPDSFIRMKGQEVFLDRIKNAQLMIDYKLSSLKKKYDSKTAEGKEKITSEMLVTIGKFRSEVIKSDYIKLLAHRLHVSEQALLAELQKGGKGSVKNYFNEEKKQKTLGEAQRVTVERGILKLLLEEKEFIEATKKEMLPADFQDKGIRDVVTKIFGMFDQGKGIDVGSLISSFEDQKMQQMISSLVIEDHTIAGDKKKMHSDYMSVIKKRRDKTRREDLIRKITEAESQGDHEKLEGLVKEFNQLIKK